METTISRANTDHRLFLMALPPLRVPLNRVFRFERAASVGCVAQWIRGVKASAAQYLPATISAAPRHVCEPSPTLDSGAPCGLVFLVSPSPPFIAMTQATQRGPSTNEVGRVGSPAIRTFGAIRGEILPNAGACRRGSNQRQGDHACNSRCRSPPSSPHFIAIIPQIETQASHRIGGGHSTRVDKRRDLW
jgi:hypothetical protein